MANILKGPEGNDSSKRWFAAVFLVVAVAQSFLDGFDFFSANVDIVKSLIWAAVTLGVGGTAAEQLKGIKFGGKS